MPQRLGLPRFKQLIAFPLVLAFTGCSFLPKPTRVPIEQLRLNDTTNAPCTVVLLHGRFGSPKNFQRADFHAAVAERNLNIELIAVDSHWGYYKNRTIIERLRQDVVAPLLEENKEVWLAGVSMGGLGSLLYLRHHPDDVTGLAPLAPYLGEPDLIDDIIQAGGVDGRQPSPEPDKSSLPGLWRWLIDNRSEVSEKIRLGYGVDDRLAAAGELLGELLPESQVITREGGHDWRVWRKLWVDMLDQGLICSSQGS